MPTSNSHSVIIDYEKCSECQLCVNVCPRITGNHQLPVSNHSNGLIGNYNACWIGHTSEEKVRLEAASGGIVSTLLVHALNTRLVDGVLVSRSTALEPEVFLARTQSEVLSALGSIYSPSISICVSIKDILNSDGKFAVVGLPCHIQAIRKLESMNPSLRGKIALYIGLFCCHAVSLDGVKFLLQNIDIDPDRIKELKYRAKRCGTTGMLIRTGDDKEIFLPSSKYFNRFFNFFFIPSYCFHCKDLTAECADISSGDAWLPGLDAHKTGVSIFISRNEIGDTVISSAISAGVIQADEVGQEKVVRSQKGFLHLKKQYNRLSPYGLFILVYNLVQRVCNYTSTNPRLHFLIKVWVRLLRVKGIRL